jgi:hypothetical protein
MSMSEAFRAAPADLSDAIAPFGTIVVGFAWLVAPAPATTGSVHILLANSVYTNLLSAMLVAETLADANCYARPQSADRFVGAIGVLSAVGGLTGASETGGPLRTVRMLTTGSELAVRISAGILLRALSGLCAVPQALALDARHPFRARKVADFRRLYLATAVDTQFALGTLRVPGAWLDANTGFVADRAVFTILVCLALRARRGLAVGALGSATTRVGQQQHDRGREHGRTGPSGPADFATSPAFHPWRARLGSGWRVRPRRRARGSLFKGCHVGSNGRRRL